MRAGGNDRAASSSTTRSASAIVDSRWAIRIVVRCSQQPVERLVDRDLDVHVDRARRVVEHEDRWVLEKRAGDGDPLPLAARQGVAALADDGVVADSRLADEVVRLGGRCRGYDIVDVASGPPYAMLSRTDVENRNGSSKTGRRGDAGSSA